MKAAQEVLTVEHLSMTFSVMQRRKAFSGQFKVKPEIATQELQKFLN